MSQIHQQLSSSPTSSSSTTPPSETTLNDDLMEVVTNFQACSQSAQNNLMNHKEDSLVEAQSQRDRHQRSLIPGAINTDYESSAAEDFESFALSSKYENADSAFLSYSRTNKLEKLQVLLEAKLKNEVELNLNFKGQQKQNFSWSALHLACYFGHLQVVRQILSKKQFRDEIDINIQNNSGDTPLHKATLTNRVQIVQFLLSNGANVFVRNCDGLLARQLTNDRHILDMLEAAEQVDKNRIRGNMFKAVDNGDLKKLQGYFRDYESYLEALRTSKDGGKVENDGKKNSSSTSGNPNNSDLINHVTDERGNTLLHLAAMRGFKAICVYLLEQGFDPYKKNNLGQTCIDLSSYQLRQLFTTVKPTNSQLKKLSSQRVTRFEGPLLKKVRILGWKQIYVVLENGVILLFNNRRDSMNKARRGYKYLESAICNPDTNDLSTFTVCFSDKSRATFLVSPEHLNSYASFKLDHHDVRNASPSNQIELVRQKWIDSIRDHIKYSTDFIRKGLNLNDYDEENEHSRNDGDLATLNHLLPIDTIKSFIQEARAHYSILERHSESLCNLVQSINASSRLTNPISESTREHESQISITPEQSQPVVSSTTTSGRLLDLIRPSRQARPSSASIDDAGLVAQNQQNFITNSTTRIRNNSLTNEFVQDNWHCILFHLRLLVESTENTKVSMGQALTLMEHQEQLRQNRIQDQEERCRVLEDSLHALARDHHELEKSISMSQIYHSAARSMSMSTDLNEYFDAFEDFDDEKTMTPNSMPSDDDLNQKIQDVMNEDSEPQTSKGPPMRVAGEIPYSHSHSHVQFKEDMDHQSSKDGSPDYEDEREDDLQSNCSALTVESVSDLYSTNGGDKKQASSEANPADLMPSNGRQIYRSRLPSPMVPKDQVSIWSILKNCIGKELSKITMPVVFNEPLTMLQRTCEGIQYTYLLKLADQSDDPVERMELICAFLVAGLSANCHRIIKPFNPLLYETYEYDHELDDGSHVKGVAQQVSHHPPITAVFCESDNFTYNGSINPKIKFWGRSIEVQPDGQMKIYLKRHKESYVFKSVSCNIHNIIVGKLWFEHSGPLDIKCLETNLQANLVFRQAGWFSNDLHRFDGCIVVGNNKSYEKKKLKFVYGKWSDYIKSVDYSEYENYMKGNPQKLFRIPDNPEQGESNGSESGAESSINNNSIKSINQLDGEASSNSGKFNKLLSRASDKKGYTKSESTQSLDIPNSRTLWRLESQYLQDYYNFTSFTMRLNELTPELASILPRTDSRFRPDVRKLEEGDLDGAANEKQRLEEKQRENRSRDKRFKDPSPDLLWFDLINEPASKDKFWIYKGDYWESKCKPEKFPDLF